MNNSNKYGNIVTKIHPKDEMYSFFKTHPLHRDNPLESYFESGDGMISSLLDIIGKIDIKIEDINNFLEFACGYGRFTRHLVKIIPPNKITGSDVFKEAVDFQKEVFGVKGFYSAFKPKDVEIPEKYDIIFVASLFSHLPKKTWRSWLKKLYNSLNENGVLIFSTHGITCMANPDDMPKSGFLHLRISESKIHSLREYGLTYTTPEFVQKTVFKETGQSIFLEIPKGLWNYQDVYVLKQSSNDAQRLPGRINNITPALNIFRNYILNIRSYFKSGFKKTMTLPPDELNKHIGGSHTSDYAIIGDHFFEIFKKYGDIKNTDRVLDVGCGCGRMAIPLTKFLTIGTYDGFDIMPEHVKWCKQNITPRYPKFKFQLADVFHELYRKEGRTKSKDFRFPYCDNSFDFTFLTSVFTHMLKDDIAHYTSEIFRTLRFGGTALITFFILNDESEILMNTQAAIMNIPFDFGDEGIRVTDPNNPEAVIGYPETMIRQILTDNGLTIIEPIYFGSWSGRQDSVTFQDLVILRKI